MTRSKRSGTHPARHTFPAVFLSLCAACTAKPIPVEIEFDAEWKGQVIRCAERAFGLSDLRFFVSDPVLVDSDGGQHVLVLTPDARWQQGRIALLDLEDGTGGCANGTHAMNSSIRGTVTAADFTGIRFTVGVPFDLNHQNPLLARPPLDDSAMHWHWRSGYKFLRVGVADTGSRRWLHLGSTACEGTVQNISACRSPNRVTVDLPAFSPTANRVLVDLSELFGNAGSTAAVNTNCSSGPGETSCAEFFEALGLPFGELPGASQRVFRVGE